MTEAEREQRRYALAISGGVCQWYVSEVAFWGRVYSNKKIMIKDDRIGWNNTKLITKDGKAFGGFCTDDFNKDESSKKTV